MKQCLLLVVLAVYLPVQVSTLYLIPPGAEVNYTGATDILACQEGICGQYRLVVKKTNAFSKEL